MSNLQKIPKDGTQLFLAPGNQRRIKHCSTLNKKDMPQPARLSNDEGRNGATLKPWRSSAAAASRTACRVSGITGVSPSSSNQPMGICFASAIEILRILTGAPLGSAGCLPATVRNSRSTSAMVRAIGPIELRMENGPVQGGKCPADGMRPEVGLSAQMPEKCAGSRTDPPLSLPRPPADSPAAIAAASPPLDPPAVRSSAQGLCVRP